MGARLKTGLLPTGGDYQHESKLLVRALDKNAIMVIYIGQGHTRDRYRRRDASIRYSIYNFYSSSDETCLHLPIQRQ